LTFEIRKALSSDHPRIMEVMPGWWGGRDLRPMLPRLFLVHFNDTSLIAEDRGVPGTLDYNRPGDAKVLFKKCLD
jgi:hypothetical protein